jgi:hypothetical protein
MFKWYICCTKMTNDKTLEDSKFRGTCNHSPSINISVDITVQNVLHWRADVRTVLGTEGDEFH